MKRFRSKVATLLDLRRRREEQVLRSHATALFERQAALDRLQAVSGAIESLRQDIGQSMASGCSAAVLAQFHGYGGRLEADRTAAANAVGQAEAAVAKSLEKVLGARRERESVEKFQARERESHERENLRDEQKLLDEIALRRVSGVWGARALA
jgi:flagellar FliJ protein